MNTSRDYSRQRLEFKPVRGAYDDLYEDPVSIFSMFTLRIYYTSRAGRFHFRYRDCGRNGWPTVGGFVVMDRTEGGCEVMTAIHTVDSFGGEEGEDDEDIWEESVPMRGLL
jgi:hypothetical protein